MKKKSRGKTIFVTAVVVLAALFFAYHYIAAPDPVISGYEVFKKLPRKKHIVFTVRNDRPVGSVSVIIVQGLRRAAVIDEKNVGKEKTFDFILEPRSFAVTDGPATVVIKAESGLFSKTELSVDSTVDTVPPVIKRVVSTPFVKQGSTGAVKASVLGAQKVYVKVGDDEFPMAKSFNGKKNVYCTLFPVPLSASPGTPLSVVADDGNDNYRTERLDTTILTRKFRKSNVDISEEFIDNHIISLLGREGNGLSEKAAFRKVNEEWRREDNKAIEEAGQRSEGSPLWNGRFLQLRGSRVFAKFGDKRDYYYQGEKISASRHLGYDLASVRHAAVTAANAGIVVYVGQRLIYGNVVIIDHGLGLMSLYGHMSQTSVKAGQHVSKGETIGRTGNTGLALGDHLHFGIYVHGIAVNPLDWWDGNWIRNKIMRVLSS
ncbi:MAG: M23 family metallopeptidase [Candidatus Sulfobium sp.]|jgi:murein DD-endopeptidase MepM/ murein hydrolase activator NlpD